MGQKQELSLFRNEQRNRQIKELKGGRHGRQGMCIFNIPKQSSFRCIGNVLLYSLDVPGHESLVTAPRQGQARHHFEGKEVGAPAGWRRAIFLAEFGIRWRKLHHVFDPIKARNGGVVQSKHGNESG